MIFHLNRRRTVLVPFVILVIIHHFKLHVIGMEVINEENKHESKSAPDDIFVENPHLRHLLMHHSNTSSRELKDSKSKKKGDGAGGSIFEKYIEIFRQVFKNAKKSGNLPSDLGVQGLLPTELILLILFTVLSGASPEDFDLTDRDRCPSDENDRKFALDMLITSYLGYRTFFTSQSILTGEEGISAQTPGLCTTSYISHESIKKGQADLPMLQTAGYIVRGNELGLFRLNFRTFEYCLDMLPIEEHDFCGIVLGMPNDDHERLRPRIDAIWGDGNPPGTTFSTSGPTWSKQGFLDSANEFLQGKTQLNFPADITFWTIKELHKQALGIVLPDAQVQAFVGLQSASLLLAILPTSLVDDVAAQFGTSVDAINLGKKSFVTLYKSILPGIFPDLASDDVELTKTAMALLDGFIFAGGASVPATIQNGLAAYFEGLTPNKKKFSMTNPEDLGVLVLETVRSYPPVLGVPYISVQTGQRYAPLAGMAGYDRSVYGKDAEQFRIRGDLNYYHKRSLNWADAALPVDGVPGSNHVCPARSMSYSMVIAFWQALDAEQWCVDPNTPIVKETGPTFWGDFNIIKGDCV